MLNFTIKYLVEIVVMAITVVLACLLGSETLLVGVNYDYSFIVFFSGLFALMLPAYYFAVKHC